MFRAIQKRLKSQKGFTLIELLVVIIIIAILAAIAIPTFLGQRQKAQDASAKSLVRNSMTAAESAYVDSRTYVFADDTILKAIEPSIHWTIITTNATDATPKIDTTAAASTSTVDFFGTASTYSIASASDSGNLFGVYVNKGTSGGTTFIKKIGSTVSTGW
jgi:type IV pilus assembly protein PilA